MVLPLPLSPTRAVIDGGSSAMASEKSSTAVIRGPRIPPPKNFRDRARLEQGGHFIPRRRFATPARGARRLVKVAGDEMIRANFAQGRRFDLRSAPSHADSASGKNSRAGG